MVRGTATANELAEERTDLAIRRTVMAGDHSLIAWMDLTRFGGQFIVFVS
jgi:hypothetical protein